MEDKLTLATPQTEDANVNTEQESESTGSNEDTLAPTPQVEDGQEQEIDEYDKVWNDEDESEFESNNEEPTDKIESEPDNEVEQEQVPEQKQSYTLKHKGKEIEIDSIDELIALAQKGLDYEFKMTRIKPFRQAIDIIEKSGLEPSDVKALADIKNGNKEALDYLGSKYGINTGSEDEDIEDIFNDKEPEKNTYEPEVQNNVDPVKEYWEEYSKNKPDVAGKIVSYWEELDPTFQQELWKQDVFPAFVQSVESGEFDNVYPKAIKAKALNPAISWLQAYVSSAQDIIQPKQQKKPTGSVNRKETKKRSAVKSDYDDYDAVWNENTSLDELEQQLFKGV